MYLLNCFIKRIFDIVSAGALALVLTPLWIVVAIAIKLDSKGPVFFKQNRRTKDGRVFKMLKFRSMVVNAEQMAAGLFNYENDPRVTKVGRFLRDTSIDELPQLFNIIKGDMSVVGPRPCVEYELGDFDTLNKRYKKRFQVKAGLTGLAQTMGRNDNSWDNKVTYDNQYVDAFKKIGVLIDIKILWNSVIKVSKKENIYENKADESMTDAEAAKYEEEEIIRIAHLPD
ncbi:MAG: sugar transferase [Fibrobacter sp.]|nr:sugar transferase [Fibrobacter sp.]